MSIDTYDFVHLSIYAMGGEIRGKTTLQKKIYFLGALTGCLDELGYRPHFYGPYSDEVADAAGRLKSLDFLRTTTSEWGMDQRGFERVRTDYRLTEDGEVIAKNKVRQFPELYKEIQDAVSKMNDAGNLDYMKLSVAAKTHLLQGKNGGPTSKDELVNKAKTFGWSVSNEQVDEASRFLQSLNLVQISCNR